LQQLELFEFEFLSVTEKQRIFDKIRSEYWYLRAMRKWKPNDARRRQIYRRIDVEKKRLLLAGVSKTEILLFLSCCRQSCKLGRDCPFCRAKFL
jgi:hypothetical protein